MGVPEPSPNALSTAAGFTTGKWEGDTLTVRTTHVKTAWIRRGNGIPGSDQSTYTVHITRHDDLLTIVTIQEDPIYLTEPHVVSRVWQLDPRGNQGGREQLQHRQRDPPARGHRHRSALPARQESGSGLHDPHLQPPERGGDGVRGDALSGVPQEDQGHLQPPASCGRYCCGWIERQGLPGAAPGLTCNDGGLGDLGPKRRDATESEGGKQATPAKK